MRLRPHFGDTYVGIFTITVGGAAACALLSAVMFLFRPVCEPILRNVLRFFVQSVGGYYVYDPRSYWFWDGYAALLSTLAFVIAAIVIIRKPAQDWRIDNVLRGQTTEISHGAPLEPD